MKALNEAGFFEQEKGLFSRTIQDTGKNESPAKGLKRASTAKRKIVRSGDITDDRNIRNKAKQIDPFIRVVKQELGLDVWPEFYFSKERKYRLDYALPLHKLAVEVDGGIFMRGKSGHSSGKGIKRDQEKASLLAALGWRLIRLTPSELVSLRTIELIKKAIENTTT